MRDIVKQRIFEIFKAPRRVRRLSEAAGLILILGWLGYVAQVSVTKGLGWPASDEQLDIAVIAILLFAAGWFCVRFGFHRIGHR
jgi:hypothetical protein